MESLTHISGSPIDGYYVFGNAEKIMCREEDYEGAVARAKVYVANRIKDMILHGGEFVVKETGRKLEDGKTEMKEYTVGFGFIMKPCADAKLKIAEKEEKAEH